MDESALDRDLLAQYLQEKLSAEELTLRDAAPEIGCSVATLSRLLKGNAEGIQPDTTTLIKAASWVGRSISDFQKGSRPTTSNLTEVELHLRALPELSDKDKDALVAMVKAVHDAARKLRNDQT